MIRPIDLGRLIEGLMVVILLAIAVGKYGELRRFAVEAGMKALTQTNLTRSFYR